MIDPVHSYSNAQIWVGVPADEITSNLSQSRSNQRMPGAEAEVASLYYQSTLTSLKAASLTPEDLQAIATVQEAKRSDSFIQKTANELWNVADTVRNWFKEVTGLGKTNESNTDTIHTEDDAESICLILHPS